MNLREAFLWQGVGQSGYTAGRREHDPALDRELQVRNTIYPRGIDDEKAGEELGTDDRWTGRGGTVAPDEATASPEG
jgi:hypothetical protein